MAEEARRLGETERDLARAEAEIRRLQTRESELERTIERLEVRLKDWRGRANALSNKLDEQRSTSAPLGVAPTGRTTPTGVRSTKRKGRKRRR